MAGMGLAVPKRCWLWLPGRGTDIATAAYRAGMPSGCKSDPDLMVAVQWIVSEPEKRTRTIARKPKRGKGHVDCLLINAVS